MTILQRGMSLVLVTLMTLSPLTALAQGDAAAETSSGAGQAPQTTVTAPDITQPATVEEPTTSVEDTAPTSLDTESLPQLAPEEATPATEDSDLEAQLVSQDGLFRYKQYGDKDELCVIITEYLGEDPDIVVPATLDGKKVVEVNEYFVSYGKYDTIKSITLADGITKWGNYSSSSFSSYSNLETLKLPSTLESTTLTINGDKLTNLQAPTITTLDLKVGNDSVDLSYLKSLSDLTNLNLSLSCGLTTASTNALNGISSLAKLSISMSGTDGIDSLIALKSQPAFTSLSLSSMDTKVDLTPIGLFVNLESLTLDSFAQLTNLSILSKCTNLSTLTIKNNSNLFTLDGISGLSSLSSINCKNCSNLKDIKALEHLDQLTYVNLQGTQVSDADAYNLIIPPEDITIYPACPQTIRFKRIIITAGDNMTFFPYRFKVDNPEIADCEEDVSYNTVHIAGKSAGTTTVHIYYYNGTDTGKSFKITSITEAQNPEQPIRDELQTILPKLSSIPYSTSEYKTWGQYSDGTLWNLSEEQPVKIMDNVKSYVGAFAYVRKDKDSWAFITDNNNTLWTYETQPNGNTALNERVKDVTDVVASHSSDNHVISLALDGEQNVWQLKEKTGLLQSGTTKVDSDVKQIAACTLWIGYLKNNGDLYVKSSSQYDTKKALTKVDTNVTELIPGEEDSSSNTNYYDYYYRKSDGNVYSLSEGFVDIDSSGMSDDEWQLTPEKKDIIRKLYGASTRYTIALNNTTYYSYYNPVNGKITQVTAFDTPMTEAKKGRINDSDVQYDLLTDGNGNLWEINPQSATVDKTLIADSFVSFTTNGYRLSDGTLHDLEHKIIDSNVKQILSFNNREYILKMDGLVYLNAMPLLDHVDSLSSKSDSWDNEDFSKNALYFTRTDGTIWTMPESGELKPYKLCDYLGSALLIGDTNDDGLINASDALQDLRHSVKEIELTGDAFTRGNVNKDEFINASDALQILRYSVKEITEF